MLYTIITASCQLLRRHHPDQGDTSSLPSASVCDVSDMVPAQVSAGNIAQYCTYIMKSLRVRVGSLPEATTSLWLCFAATTQIADGAQHLENNQHQP